MEVDGCGCDRAVHVPVAVPGVVHLLAAFAAALLVALEIACTQMTVR